MESHFLEQVKQVKPLKRNRPRYRSQAQVYIIDVLKDAILKNISIKGCCIVSKNQVDIKINEMYVIHVVPENATGLGKFELLVEARWIRSDNGSNEIGFWIISSPVSFLQYQQLCHKERF